LGRVAALFIWCLAQSVTGTAMIANRMILVLQRSTLKNAIGQR